MIHIFINALVIGYITGIFTAIPIGPAAMESIKRTLANSLKQGLLVCAGAVVADSFYILLINCGLASLLSSNKTTESLFWVISGIILTYIGYTHLRDHYDETESAIKFIDRNNFTSNSFLVGFIITFVNPLTPSLWLFMSGTVIRGWYANGLTIYYTFIIAIISGMTSWLFGINYFAHKGVKILNSKNSEKTLHFMMWIIVLMGIGFVGYGSFEFIKSLI
ncbi:MAG: LysE family translocator [Clostridiaceae bacterium]